MEKMDLRKQYAHLYKASARKPALIDVPELNYLMVDGRGHPESNPAFQEAMGALFGISYTLKFHYKMEKGIDWTVMCPEGLWSVPGAKGPADVARSDKSQWRWTLMIMQPDLVTPAALHEARAELVRRHPEQEAAAARVRVERLEEGTAVQMLHVGPYAGERPTVEKMIALAEENGCAIAGLHHEIYLSDPRRTAPAKLKTILRHPLRKKGEKS